MKRVKKIKGFCIKSNMNTKHKHLDTNHNYYYQNQCQLYCGKKQWCDFVVKAKNDLHVEGVPK